MIKTIINSIRSGGGSSNAVLDMVGLGLLTGAAYIQFGLAAGLAAAGVACFLASFMAGQK